MATDVLSQIETLYTTIDNEERLKADRYLQRFQKSEKSWHICRQILEIENQKFLESNWFYLFACTTLSTKILFQSQNLNRNSREHLKVFLLQKLTHFHRAAKTNPRLQPVANLLCQCIAMHAIIVPEWTEIIPRLTMQFHGTDPELLIRLLGSLPGEFDVLRKRYSSIISVGVLDEFEKNELIGKANLVLEILEKAYVSAFEIGPPNPEIALTITTCFNGWMEHTPFSYLNSKFIDNMKLIDFILESFFTKQENFYEFSNAVVNICRYIEVSRIYQLEKIYAKEMNFLSRLNSEYIQKLMEMNEISWEMAQKVEQICSIVVTASCSLIDRILECDDQALALLRVVLNCLDIKCRSANVIVVEFFVKYIFEIEVIYMTCDFSEQKNMIRHILSETIQKALKNCTATPSDSESKTSFNKEFIKLRSQYNLILTMCLSMIDVNMILERVIFPQITSSASILTPQVESALYAIASIWCKKISRPNLIKIIRIIEETLNKNSFGSNNLILTTNLVVCQGFEELSPFPSFLQSFLRYVIWQIDLIEYVEKNKNEFSESISTTFETICNFNPEKFSEDTEIIIKSFSSYSKFTTDEDKKIFISGVIAVISSTLSAEIFEKNTMGLIDQCLIKINALPFNEERTIEGVEGIAYIIKCLSNIKKGKEEQLNRIVRSILKVSWDTFLKDAIKNLFSHEKLMEVTVSRLCKYSVRYFPASFKDLVLPILNIFEYVAAKETVSSGFIYLSSIFIEIYHSETDLARVVLRIFTQYFFRELTVYQNEVRASEPKKSILYTLEDFFRLCYKFSNFAPVVLYDSQYFERIFFFAVKELNVCDYVTFKLIFDFIRRIAIKSQNKTDESFENIMIKRKAMECITNHFSLLVLQIVKGIYSQDKGFMSSYNELLTILFSVDEEVVSNLIKKAMEFELGEIDEEVKIRFLANLREEKSEEKRCEILWSFNDICQLHYINKK